MYNQRKLLCACFFFTGINLTWCVLAHAHSLSLSHSISLLAHLRSLAQHARLWLCVWVCECVGVL